jgi:hypothetical protein
VSNIHTVRELIELLQTTADPEDLVILSSDEEGNSYSPFNGFDLVMYFNGSYSSHKPEAGWPDPIMSRPATPEQLARGEIPEESEVGRPEDGYVPAIVLYPS